MKLQIFLGTFLVSLLLAPSRTNPAPQSAAPAKLKNTARPICPVTLPGSARCFGKLPRAATPYVFSRPEPPVGNRLYLLASGRMAP
jgi:hypothetical protein